jgi:hypothetical protein
MLYMGFIIWLMEKNNMQAYSWHHNYYSLCFLVLYICFSFFFFLCFFSFFIFFHWLIQVLVPGNLQKNECVCLTWRKMWVHSVSRFHVKTQVKTVFVSLGYTYSLVDRCSWKCIALTVRSTWSCLISASCIILYTLWPHKYSCSLCSSSIESYVLEVNLCCISKGVSAREADISSIFPWFVIF